MNDARIIHFPTREPPPEPEVEDDFGLWAANEVADIATTIDHLDSLIEDPQQFWAEWNRLCHQLADWTPRYQKWRDGG